VRRSAGRARGALEREVLACLSVAEQPLTAAQVQEELDDGLAYTTVLTTLTRLFQKGALDRSLEGRAYRYRIAAGPGGAASSMTAHQMRHLLDSTGDRAAVLARFVADLDAEDEKLLMRLLAEIEPDGGTGR
jgi:predicted transcriptional regulator